MIVCIILSIAWSLSPAAAAREVVVYTSVDQVFSEPILKDFDKRTGIATRAVYDVEASKTTGLVNRLLAERRNPKCDVFWNNEVARTIILMKNNVLQPYHSPAARDLPEPFKQIDGYFAGFAARARVLVYNTRMLNPSEAPRSIFDLIRPKWKGKFAMAYPLFGTTATHIAALYVSLGRERTERFLRGLKANGVVIVDGNSVVRDIVVAGELPVGLTDTDDVNVAIRAGKSVKMIYPDKDGIGTLLIPNTVGLINNAPNPEEGKRLIDYLLSKEVESRIAFSESANMPLRDGVEKPPHIPEFTDIKAMSVDYLDIAANIKESAKFCRDLFVR